MAEIEFKRRGTPLWAVLLALIVIALVIWFFLRQRAGAPTSAAPTPAPTATQPGAPGAAATPAPPQTPTERYSAFVDSEAPVPEAAASTYVADGLTRLADAMQEKYPTAGVQVNLIRAMSDSLRLPGIAPRRQTDMAQAAFFAVGYAIGRADSAGRVTQAASAVQLDQPLPRQLPVVRKVFRAARDVIKGGGAAPAAPAGGAAPKG